MKKLFFVLVILLVAESSNAQSIQTLFDTTKVNFYDIIYPDSSRCFFYYTDSNKNNFCQECFSKKGIRNSLQYFVSWKKNGPAISWFETGKLRYIENYIMNCPAGSSIEWYENGQIKETGNYYVEATDSLISLTWFHEEEKKIDSNTIVESTTTFEGYRGLKDDLWKYYSIDGKEIKTEMWNKGKLIWRK
jgi:antitoxin component YwqK of YwqJK toxin-antitoxin module